MGSRLYNLSK